MTERSFWGGIVLAVVFIFSVSFFASAFNGPTQNPPSGSGAISTDSSNRVGINISTGTYRLNVADGDVGLYTGTQIQFGLMPEDKIYYFGQTYGTGIEAATLTDWSQSQFRWRIGGISAGGGTQHMLLSANGLFANNIFATTSVTAVGGYVSSTQFCLGGSCINNWASAGGGGGGGTQWIISGATMYATTTGITSVFVSSTANFGVGDVTPQVPLSVRRGGSGTAFAVRNIADSGDSFSVTDAGAVSASGSINTTGVFQRNGVNGTTTTCGAGQVLGTIAVSGGIVTSGTCITPGGAVYQ
jgi:hypothetical protein